MKSLSQLFTIALGAVAGGALVFTLIAGQPLAQVAGPLLVTLVQANSDKVCNTGRTVQVSGSAAINVTPDRVLLQLGVVSNAVTPEAVEAENTAVIKQIIDALRQLGVADKDISTDYYLVQPVYDDYSSLTIIGYRLDNVVAVTLKDINKSSEVLIAALKAGANEVRDVQFYTSELRHYRDEARKLAMQAAAEKAELLAEAGGAQAGCVLNINENSWSYYNGYWWGGRDRAMWTQNVVQNAATGQSTPEETPISVGQIVVKAEVSASFSIE